MRKPQPSLSTRTEEFSPRELPLPPPPSPASSSIPERRPADRIQGSLPALARGGAVNLLLPFDEVAPCVLDEYLAHIDRELDALFLDDVQANLEQLRGDGVTEARAADAA